MGWVRKRGQDMRARRKCAHLFILFRFRFDFVSFGFYFFLFLCVFPPRPPLLSEIFKWFGPWGIRTGTGMGPGWMGTLFSGL